MSFWEPLQEQFERSGNPQRAKQQEAYMRNQYEFYGIMMGPLKALLNEFYKTNKATDWEELKEQVLWCWEQPQREWQMVGMNYLQKMKKLWGEDLIEFSEVLITTKSWWDTVDFLASNAVGEFLKDKPELAVQEMGAWNHSGHKWKIRTSIIFQLKYKNEVNHKFLAHAILNHSDSKEFF